MVYARRDLVRRHPRSIACVQIWMALFAFGTSILLETHVHGELNDTMVAAVCSRPSTCAKPNGSLILKHSPMRSSSCIPVS